VSRSSDRVQLAITSAAPAIFLAINSYSPYWQAIVDGRIARVFPVYHAFQGVYLEAGRHDLTLQYVPPYRIWRP
jgi:uncharacterized membrane protein YfhO